MPAPMASGVMAVHPNSAFIIDGSKPQEDAIPPSFFLFRCAWVSEISLVPDDFVGFLLVDA